jgi:hypothetical protein
MNPAIIDATVRYETSSPGGGHTYTEHALTVEYDEGTSRPSGAEVRRLAEQYLADRNGYVGHITAIWYDGEPVTQYGSTRAIYMVSVTREW